MKLKLFLLLCGLTACVPQSRVVCGGDGQLTELNDGRIFCGYAVIIGGFRGCPQEVPFRLELPNGYACSNRPIPSSGDLPPQVCAQLMCSAVDGGLESATPLDGGVDATGKSDASIESGMLDSSRPPHDWRWRYASTSQSPGARQGHTMAYDSLRQVVVLYGGLDASDRMQTSLWEWNGETWSPRTPISGSPSARPSGTQQLVFGETMHAFGETMNEQWTYDGTNWRRYAPAGWPTPSRIFASIAYDGSRDTFVMFGGVHISGPGWMGEWTVLPDTWHLVGDRWEAQSPATSPSPRVPSALVYNPDRQTVMMVGGCASIPCGIGDERNDLWEWNGTTWNEIVAPGGPSIRREPVVFYHTGLHLLVVSGGWVRENRVQVFRRDTWTFDGVRWQAVDAVAPERTSVGYAFDASRQQLVLYGGQDPENAVDGTWILE